MKSRFATRTRRRPACALAGAVLLTMAVEALAAPEPPLAPATTSGDFTVTLQDCNSSGTMLCAGQWIEEQTQSNGAWLPVAGTFVDKPAGVWSYRSAAAYCDAWYSACYAAYSSTVTVIVLDGELPLPEPLDQQLEYRYSVRYGNVVGNAGTELLIERTSGPAAGNGVIDAVVLQQLSGGGFTALVPSEAQRNSSGWQASNLAVSVEDMNADGYVDIALRDLATLVPGAEDQIVFASASTGDAPPKGIRAFDDSLRQFTANVIDYIADNRYFIDNAGFSVYTWSYGFRYCPGPNPIDGGSMASMLFCTTVVIPNYTIVPDYSSFDAAAVSIWQDEVAAENGDLTPGAAADRILGRIEDVFDIAIGGWNMREIFGDGPGSDKPAERRGLEGFLAVLGIGNARADEVEPDAAQTQGPRANDIIHIVSRYVFGSTVNKMHTAVLYKMPGTGAPTWYSAFDSDDRALVDGTLVAKTNAPADSPLLMRMTLGEVVPPAPQSRFVHFFTDMQSAHEHYKGLPQASLARYDAVPEFPCGGCNGRNSNGYVSGLILAGNAQPSAPPGFSFNALTGWEYPVEAHYFGR